MYFWHACLFLLLLEAFTLFYVLGQIGFFKTLFLWLLSAAIGSIVIQRQGFATLLNVQNVMNRGAVPVDDLFDGICLVIAGLLFLIPGFISDALAFLLLIPSFRKYLREKNVFGQTLRTAPTRAADDGVIDGTYVRVEETVEQIEKNQSLPPKSKN